MEPLRLFLTGKSDLPSPLTVPSQPLSSSLMIESSISSASASSSPMKSASWLWRNQLCTKPKAGFSWIDAENCRYMCDIFPSMTTVSLYLMNAYII